MIAPRLLPSAARALLLGLVVFVIACMVYGRWTAKDWQRPIEYGITGIGGDVLGMQLAPIKAASEGSFPLIASKKIAAFGAPYEGSWDDFPTTEEFHVVVPGLLARWIGLFPALNLFGLLAHVTSALGFYLACRLLGYRREWACAGAAVFGFSLFIFARSLHHLSIGWAGHIPLMIVVARWAFSSSGAKTAEATVQASGTLLDRSRFLWAIGIAAITGVQHVYYTNMLVQFLGLAMLYHAFHRRWNLALRAVAVGTVAVVAFLIVNLDTFGSRIANGPNPGALIRTYQYLEYSGFKLADLFIPPAEYWITPLGQWGNRYFAEVILKGEVPVGSFLGIVGIAAFVWLAAAALRNLAVTPAHRPPWEAMLGLWVVIYATVGGLNAWAGSLGFVLFRSTTRYSVYLLALALLFAVRRLSSITLQWTPEKRIAAAFAVAMVALWDQVPRTPNEDPIQIAAAVDSDRTFAQEMESRLKPGAMVFQLPLMDFPECPIPGVPSYEHFRPYLYTKALRYSFGDVKGRPHSAWQNEVALLAPEEMMQRLESYGFGAICVNRGGYPDGGKELLEAAANRAATVFESPRKDLFCILLRPSDTPVLPPPGPYFGFGWGEAQRNAPGIQIRDCRGNSEIVLTNPGTEPAERYIQCFLLASDEREIKLSLDGEALASARLAPQRTARVQNMKVILKPGENRLAFASDAPPVLTMKGPQLFQLINFRVTGQPMTEQ